MGTEMRCLRGLMALSALWLAQAAWAEQAVPGLLSVREDGTAQLHFVAQPPPGQPVHVQLPGRRGKAQCCTRLAFSDLRALPQTDEPLSLSADQPVFSYAVAHKLPGRFGLGGFLGVAMSASKVSAAGKGLVAAPAQSNAGAPRTQAPRTQAHLCQGQEGVNLIAHSGPRVQVLYLGFGYEAEAEPGSACTAQDLKLIGQAGN